MFNLVLVTVVGVTLFSSLWQPVSSHARIMDPVGRSSMWRKNYDTPKNYDDAQLWCGGRQIQLEVNGGKCGVCGDAWNAPEPRDNEAGGKYGNHGIIVRNYKKGEMITAKVQVEAFHKGYLEFKVCGTNDWRNNPTQECLDKNPLTLADDPSETRFKLPGRGLVSVDFQLPQDLECSFCVLQFLYNTGNHWGVDPVTGESGVGFGPQEQFVNCANVQIE